MSEEHSLLSDTTFWYGMSVLAFVVMAVKLAGKPILGVLDAEIAKVRADLQTAADLKKEAEATLASYREKQKAALAEAEAIVQQAKDDAARLRADAEIELKKTMERHEQKALQRIAAAEKEAMDEVRALIVRSAVAEAQKNLSTRIDGVLMDALNTGGLAEVAAVAPQVKGRIS